jgi:hypothetical protein
MTNPTIKIHNVETGEVIEREMNAKELAQLKQIKLKIKQHKMLKLLRLPRRLRCLLS